MISVGVIVAVSAKFVHDFAKMTYLLVSGARYVPMTLGTSEEESDHRVFYHSKIFKILSRKLSKAFNYQEPTETSGH